MWKISCSPTPSSLLFVLLLVDMIMMMDACLHFDLCFDLAVVSSPDPTLEEGRGWGLGDLEAVNEIETSYS
jgi:hypothetical protein